MPLTTFLPHIPGYLPLTYSFYCTLLTYWSFFPLVFLIQSLTPWYPTGKTSYPSLFNLPGRFAWMTMELPSPLLLLTTALTVSESHSLPIPTRHWILIALFLIHYFNRATVNPILMKETSPMHVIVWIFAIAFNCVNPVLIGGWLGGYGQVETPMTRFVVGVGVWLLGFVGNLYHETILRGIRARSDEIKKKAKDGKNGDDSPGDEDLVVRIVDGRVYTLPKGGLFRYILYPHYFCEWIEWAGFYIAAGSSCTPALMFVVNEVSTMLPRALGGKQWYKEKFGENLPQDIKAAVPFLI